MLTALGQIAGLSLPLCIIIAGTIIMLYLIWEYRPITAQYNPMERMEASMLAIKVIDDKQCSSLYAAVMLKSPPMLRYTGPCASRSVSWGSANTTACLRVPVH